MASSSNKKVRLTKRAREHQQRERRIEKQAKKAARKLAAADDSVRSPEPGAEPDGDAGSEVPAS